MKICKKLTALLLCLITVFGFVSCADDGFVELFVTYFTKGGGLYMQDGWDEDISEPDFVDFTVYRKHFNTWFFNTIAIQNNRSLNQV